MQREEVTIAKLGRPVAVTLSPEEKGKGLASIRGWLDENDTFFKEMESMMEKRHKHGLRAAAKGKV